MTSLIAIKTYIEDIFKTNRFAVRGIDDVYWWTIDELDGSRLFTPRMQKRKGICKA